MGRAGWPVRVKRLHTDTSVWLGIRELDDLIEVYGRDPDGRWARSTTDRTPADPRLQQLFEWLCSIGEEQGLTEVAGRWGEEGPEIHY